MLVHTPGGDATLLDFFVSAGGLGDVARGAELEPVEIDFGDTTQVFNIGPPPAASPASRAGSPRRRSGSGRCRWPTSSSPAVGLARDGFEITPQHAYLFEILAPILAREPAGAAVYAPGGRMLGRGERVVFAELAETLERLGADGPEPFYRGDIAAAIAATVRDGGGTLSAADLEGYETVVARAGAGPLRRLRDPHQPAALVRRDPDRLCARAADPGRRCDRPGQRRRGDGARRRQARTREFLEGLYEPGFETRFLADRLGSTTHITALDADGGCASVTCSNGSGSGVFVPGTGIQLNNMLGEEDLNPFGFHATRPGRRMPSMMSPTIALRDGGLVLGLGSGGSNRIRSAVIADDHPLPRRRPRARRTPFAPRGSTSRPESSTPSPGSTRPRSTGSRPPATRVVRWRAPNLFFGGVHAVAAGHDAPRGRRRSAPRRRSRLRLTVREAAARRHRRLTAEAASPPRP